MRIVPLMAMFSNSPDKSFVVIEGFIICTLVASLVAYGCRVAGFSADLSGAAGIVLSMFLVRFYGSYLNKHAIKHFKD
jgi:hypothetical protein